MFDNLRGYFEIGLIGLFLISTISYFIYKLTISKRVNSKVKTATNSLDLTKKEKKGIKARIIDTELKNTFEKTVFFFADLFWVLLFVVVVRSFIYEPFVIPSKSMKPGLLIGDVVLVNKNTYGLILPAINKKITNGKINRGDVAVFKYPRNPEISYIKRIIGIPGDKVFYDNRNLTINGKGISLEKIRDEEDSDKFAPDGRQRIVKTYYNVFEEDVLGKKHEMRYDKDRRASFVDTDLTVPEGFYFVMGDNRDNSADGRDFGLLPVENMIGRADMILLNWGCFTGKGNCNRFFKKIK